MKGSGEINSSPSASVHYLPVHWNRECFELSISVKLTITLMKILPITACAHTHLYLALSYTELRAFLSS